MTQNQKSAKGSKAGRSSHSPKAMRYAATHRYHGQLPKATHHKGPFKRYMDMLLEKDLKKQGTAHYLLPVDVFSDPFAKRFAQLMATVIYNRA